MQQNRALRLWFTQPKPKSPQNRAGCHTDDGGPGPPRTVTTHCGRSTGTGCECCARRRGPGTPRAEGRRTGFADAPASGCSTTAPQTFTKKYYGFSH